MPETTTANPGTINRQSWSDDITLLEPQKTPYTSLVSKTGDAVGMLHETFTDRKEPPRKTGAREGGASGQGGNALKNIRRHGAYQHFSQRKWSVTHHQQLIAGRGGLAGVPNAIDRSRARKELELKIDGEAVNCSDLDTQDGAGGSADMQTRGAVKWLTPVGTTLGSGATLVDPAVQATLASVITHGNATVPLFSESMLNGQLKELATIRGDADSYDAILGANVVETLDLFSRIASPSMIVNPNQAQFYTTRQGPDEHTLELMVNVYKTSFGMLNSILSFFVKVDDSGVADPNAGLVLDTDLWCLDMLENINEAGTFKTETVEGGTWQMTWINLCEQPRGNGLIRQAA